MSGQMLSLALRPKTFARVIGQDKTLRLLRKQMEKRIPAAIMFVGPKGSGKTTLSRIIALSLQCIHQKEFGLPCKACRKRRKSFDIFEANSAEVNKKDDVAAFIEGFDNFPRPGSRFRVYIFDEFQATSKESQELMLKYIEPEAKDNTTVAIFNTTAPQRINPMLQSRCMTYKLRSLDLDGIKLLVARGLTYCQSDLAPSPLADALVEKQVTSGRLICMAIDKYLSGASPEEAALVDASGEVDTYEICRNLIKGDWDFIRKQLANYSTEDARGIRLSVASYLNSILLDEKESCSRGKALANCISELTNVPPMEDRAQFSVVCAALYKMCSLFTKYKF